MAQMTKADEQYQIGMSKGYDMGAEAESKKVQARIEGLQETVTELRRQNEALFTIIQRMVNGATGTMGVNSLDREYAHITQNVLDIGRDALKDTNRKYNHRPTRPFMSAAAAKARG